MSYYSGTINFTLSESARFTAVEANSDAACVQCYVGDELLGAAVPAGGRVMFHVEHLQTGQYVRLLSVDAADAETNYFAEAWPLDRGNRITTKTPTRPGWLGGELWRVYVDDVLVFERFIWPYPDSPSCRIGGRGELRGLARGIETYGSGRGNWRGLQHGYEPVTLLHESPMYAPGIYEIATTVVDNAGNETIQAEYNLTHDTYPDEPEELAVAGYAAGDLALTFTESEDL